MSRKLDLDFLKEIKGKLVTGVEKNDPTLIEYAIKMVSDWIDELEEN